MRQLGSPFKLSECPVAYKMGGYPLGYHTKEVIESLGLNYEQLKAAAPQHPDLLLLPYLEAMQHALVLADLIDPAYEVAGEHTVMLRAVLNSAGGNLRISLIEPEKIQIKCVVHKENK